MSIQVRDVHYGDQFVQFTSGTGKRYVRVNTSTNVVPRSKDEAVLVNVVTGKLKIVAKDAMVYQA